MANSEINVECSIVLNKHKVILFPLFKFLQFFRISKSLVTYPCCTGCNCKMTWVLVSSGFSPSFPSVGTTTTSPTGTLTSALAIFHMKSGSCSCCQKQGAPVTWSGLKSGQPQEKKHQDNYQIQGHGGDHSPLKRIGT